MRVIGIDPGLQKTGWGIISFKEKTLCHIANGTISSTQKLALSCRLKQLYIGLYKVIETWDPKIAAVETIFTNKNFHTSLKLAHARSIALLVPSIFCIPIVEYAPNTIKNTIVGFGHANKEQVLMMVKRMLPGSHIQGYDSSDALAIALSHVQHHTKLKEYSK